MVGILNNFVPYIIAVCVVVHAFILLRSLAIIYVADTGALVCTCMYEMYIHRYLSSLFQCRDIA